MNDLILLQTLVDSCIVALRPTKQALEATNMQVIHSLNVTAHHDHLPAGWPTSFTIDVFQDAGDGRYFGDCHLGCSQGYLDINTLLHDFTRRHGYHSLTVHNLPGAET